MSGAGCLREARRLSRLVGRPARELVGSAPSSVEADNLHLLHGWRVNQRGNSCPAASAAHAVRGVAGVAGILLDPSYLAIYALVRQLNEPRAAILRDTGGYLVHAMAALSSWGVVARSRWPDSSDLSEPVPVDVLEAGSLARVGVHAVQDADPIPEIETLVAARQFPIFGQVYGRHFGEGPGFDAYDGEDESGDLGHAMVIVGTRPGAKRVLNSWGDTWNGDGTAWLTDDFVRRGWGFYAVTVSPSRVV